MAEEDTHPREDDRNEELDDSPVPDPEEAEAVHLTLKLTAEEREVTAYLPWVRRASHVGRYGWVTAAVTDDETLDAALEWLRESYWLKAPADVRDAALR